MSVDNTHTKYLKGKDKKAWASYAETYKAQNKLEHFIESLGAPKLKPGEVYDIPIRKEKKNKDK